MLFEELLSDERKEAREEGHAEGLAEGLAKGRSEGLAEGRSEILQKLNRLTQLLAQQNRMDDIIKAANDSDFQQTLFKEFNL